MVNSKAIDAVIEKGLADKGFVGAVVMVARNGEIVYRRAAGLADRESDQPMTEATIFRAASLTKPIVAATLLAMSDAGLLSIDDPVTAYLPYFRPRLADGTEPAITLRQLLTHTAGLTYDYSKDPRISAGLTNTDLGLDDVLQLVAEQPLAYRPGESWLYSMAIDVLGGVVAKVHGRPLSDAVAHYVTGPLGMNDTAFHVTDRTRLATPYADGPIEPVPMSDPHPAANPWGGVTTFSPSRIFNDKAFQSGGGGMAMTAPDFMRFLMAMVEDGGPVLRPETARMALQNHMSFERDPGQGFSLLGSYVVDPARADLTLPAGANNWGGIYGHVWSIDPATGISAVSLSNTAFYGGELAYPRALRHAIHADLA
ncbi:beta-lactamase family protein [Devosia sp. XJ19-1]|uniref:Beta-lactamase family protein n=1 Tax=Devosia ureilytica TaxID=2952754 RepID=A0A9Q4ALV6_9HYPH|nr:serine hydrolase domain-containing protein [Devosia ureilytica]MCP8882123.1 beta-lactamase family protein [Devosia ureilytica]MCP8885991.1 beta-lactamase family protein [Devosia ureilytica]